jgi:type III secretion protein C
MSWTVVLPKRLVEMVVAICSIFAAQLTPRVAAAASSDWRDAPYQYVVLNQSVTDVLVNFGYNTGLRMSIAPEVTGVVHGRIEATTAQSFLDALTKANDLDWYFDGSVMYVSPRSSEQTAAVPLHGASFAAVKASLARSQFWDDRYSFGWNGSSGFVTVSGPPSYVALIKQAIEAETLVTKPPSEAEASITKQAVGTGTSATKQAVEAETVKESYLVIYRGAQSTTVKFP